MKSRMFQHLIFLSLPCIFMCGCQSGPFANTSQPSDSLASNAIDQDNSEPENETAMQKKLREAMAEERAKGRSLRNQRNLRNNSAASLAEISAPDQSQNHLAPIKESVNMPVSSQGNSARPSDNTTVLHELNMAYEADRAGNVEKAQGYYQRVLSIDPNNFSALHRLAILEDKKQNYPAAEAYYLRALKIDPGNSDLLSDIGYSYMLQGRDDYGEKYLQESLKYQPGHTRSLDHLGWFYGRSGRYDQAMALFRMTSGEAQAQLKFAQLFPGVDPNIALAQGTAPQQNIQMAASEHAITGIQPVGQTQPVFTQHVQYVDAGTNSEQVNHLQTQPGNNPTLQIAEMMKREREKAIQVRGNQQLPTITPNQSNVNQVPGVPIPTSVNVQNLRPEYSDPNSSPSKSMKGDSQIQAWPPAGDPGIVQAAEASKYWATKERQQTQNLQSRQFNRQKIQQHQHQNRGSQRVPQRPSQVLPAGRPQMRRQPNIRQQRVPTNAPRVGQPQFGTQYQRPGQFPNYQMNSTQAPSQQPHSINNQQINHQEQIQEAARTAMNIGPGQMFPVAGRPQETPNDASLMNPPTPVNNVLPSSAQVPDQNIYQAGGQSIRQVPQPAYQNQRAPQITQAGYDYSNQNNRQRNGLDPALQNRSIGGFQHTNSAVPPSALYSNNPAFAPANVRTTNLEAQQGTNSSVYQDRMNRGQNSLNQNSNIQQMSYPNQRGTQQQASPYRFPVQQGGY